MKKTSNEHKIEIAEKKIDAYTILLENGLNAELLPFKLEENQDLREFFEDNYINKKIDDLKQNVELLKTLNDSQSSIISLEDCQRFIDFKNANLVAHKNVIAKMSKMNSKNARLSISAEMVQIFETLIEIQCWTDTKEQFMGNSKLD